MGIVIDGNKRDLFRIFATEDKMKEWNAKDNEANRQKVEQAKERINAKKIAPNK